MAAAVLPPISLPNNFTGSIIFREDVFSTPRSGGRSSPVGASVLDYQVSPASLHPKCSAVPSLPKVPVSARSPLRARLGEGCTPLPPLSDKQPVSARARRKLPLMDKSATEFMFTSAATLQSVWRGPGLDEGIVRFQERQAECARRRRQIQRMEGSKSRAQVIEMRKHSKSTQDEGSSEHWCASPSPDIDSLVPTVWAPSPPGGSEPEQDAGPTRSMGPRPSFGTLASPTGHSEPERHQRHSMLSEDRLKHLQRMGRSRKTLAKRQFNQEAAFAQLAPDEQKALREAFLVFRGASSGGASPPEPTSTNEEHGSPAGRHGRLSICPTLDADGLALSLERVGEVVETSDERRAVRRVCDELALTEVDFFTFSLTVVPAVRAALATVNEGLCWELFARADRGKLGLLDESACVSVLEHLCDQRMVVRGHAKLLKASFTAHLNSILPRNASQRRLNIKMFAELLSWTRKEIRDLQAAQVEEVVKAEDLTAEDLESHRADLLPFYNIFVSHCFETLPDNAEEHEGERTEDEELKEKKSKPVTPIRLPVKFLAPTLLACGVVPSKHRIRRLAAEVLRPIFQKGEALSFRSFLSLVQLVREQLKETLSREMEQIFLRYDMDSSGDLSKPEVAVLVAELGLNPRGKEDQMQIQRLLEEADADGSGDIDFHEFQTLMQVVLEMKQLKQRIKENMAGESLGLTARQISSLREAFFELDMSGDGELPFGTCKQVVSMLTQQHYTSVQLKDMLKQVDRDESGRLNFIEFMRFVKDLAARDPSVVERLGTED